MTELETEVMSLETAKLPEVQEFLKSKETKFVWAKRDNENDWNLKDFCYTNLPTFETIKTLTLGEMFDVLPGIIDVVKPRYGRYFLKSQKLGSKYNWKYHSSKYKTLIGFDDTNNKALGKLIVWCLKEGYL